MDYTTRKRLVLIVDDEVINQELLGAIIGSKYDVLKADNGKEALRLIREYQDRLSLILLDLMMPEVDGFAVLAALRDDPVLHRIPVIVLTSEKTAEVKSLKLGAVDFIPKPYDLPDVILARVERSIELAEGKSIIHATETDPMTGLYIKEFFFEYARQRDRLSGNAPMDVVTLNVNRLRVVNELHGWHYGDQVLKHIADLIKKIVVLNGGLACREGGDVFYLYLDHHEDTRKILDQLIQEISDDMRTDRITVRVGLYPNADHELQIERRFDRARQASAILSKSYQSAIAVYDEKMHEKEMYEQRLLGELEKALKEKQFRVFYQPKYSIQGDRPVLANAEALVRWFHPELGMISPGIFIPLLENNGLILKLDRFVWREAAHQIREWKEHYGRTIPVSVNVSRLDMYDPSLADEMLSIIRAEGLQPSEYLLEVTESAYTDSSEHILNFVRQVRSEGFAVEMDDFGTGYSSLNTLTSLPLDAVKLDMRFVRNLCTSERDFNMVKLMIDITKYLSLESIAEGVETKEQLDLLKKTGCDIVQGYYFSKPVPPEEFNTLIEKEIQTEQEETSC